MADPAISASKTPVKAAPAVFLNIAHSSSEKNWDLPNTVCSGRLVVCAFATQRKRSKLNNGVSASCVPPVTHPNLAINTADASGETGLWQCLERAPRRNRHHKIMT